MASYKLASLVALLLASTASAWPTTTITHAATTETQKGYTQTNGGTDFESSTTVVISKTTITQLATTATYAAWTETQEVIPSALETVFEPNQFKADNALLGGLENFAPQITSLPSQVASKLAADLEAVQSNYLSAHPEPSILTEIFNKINSAIPPGQLDDNPLWNSVFDNLGPFAAPSQTSELNRLLSAYPTLSAAVAEFQSIAPTYEAPLLLAEGSIVSSDLSLTTAPPTWVTALTNAVATSTSKAGAAPTGGVSVAVNAGAAAAGMVVLALL